VLAPMLTAVREGVGDMDGGANASVVVSEVAAPVPGGEPEVSAPGVPVPAALGDAVTGTNENLGAVVLGEVAGWLKAGPLLSGAAPTPGLLVALGDAAEGAKGKANAPVVLAAAAAPAVLVGVLLPRGAVPTPGVFVARAAVAAVPKE
jgi:hypothetical protein